eukprot:12408480-Ditylum_brightwellii.AAC.1
MFEYEEKGDMHIPKNTTFRTSKTYIGYVTKSKEEYERLISKNQHKHIVSTGRVNIPDMVAIKHTLKISQVEHSQSVSPVNNWKFRSVFLPCSCPACQENSLSDFCPYKNDRNTKGEVVSKKNENDENDSFGLWQLNVGKLKSELRERDLSTIGKKSELVLCLTAALEEEFVDGLLLMV